MDDSITGGDIQAATEAASGSSPDPTPSPESTPAVSASADTTVPPAAPTPGEVSPSTAPPVPPEARWPAILENQRKEAAAKAVAEFEQQYGWAKQINQQELQSVMQMAQRASADPINYLQDFIKELQEHPTYGPQLKSLAARALSARGQSQQAAQQEPQPDLPIQLEDGRVVHLYSAEQQAKREAFLQQQWFAKVEQQFAPMQNTFQTLQQREAHAVEQAQVQQFTSRITSDVKARPGVTDEAMKAMADLVGKDPALPQKPSYEQLELSVERAYRAVVLPNLDRASRQSVLNDLNARANASTVNPAQSSTSAPKTMDQMSIAEALAHVAARSA